MKIINLGGVGGCRITDYLIQTNIRNVAYPFDWNNTNQFFLINTIISKGKQYYSLRDDIDIEIVLWNRATGPETSMKQTFTRINNE